ncbi:hypothetical protein [Tropicimonas sp. S265A]|uniref:hypothetical protein n=1 Tax=Tropicimonas sp. S265A TaxID=3415134 RepID=UPI003C7E5CBF
MHRSPILVALVGLLHLTTAHAQDTWPAPITAKLDEARGECAAFENGELTVAWDAVRRTDLTGDGQLDHVLDLQKLTCSSAASLYCGTGGCSVLFVVGDTVTERLSKGWSVERFDFLTVLLNQMHGSACGGTNLNPCVEALVWDHDENRFFSLAD